MASGISLRGCRSPTVCDGRIAGICLRLRRCKQQATTCSGQIQDKFYNSIRVLQRDRRLRLRAQGNPLQQLRDDVTWDEVVYELAILQSIHRHVAVDAPRTARGLMLAQALLTAFP